MSEDRGKKGQTRAISDDTKNHNCCFGHLRDVYSGMEWR